MMLLFKKPPGVPCPPRNPHCNGNAPDVPLDNPYFIFIMIVIAILIIAYKTGMFAWIKHDVLINQSKQK